MSTLGHSTYSTVLRSGGLGVSLSPYEKGTRRLSRKCIGDMFDRVVYCSSVVKLHVPVGPLGNFAAEPSEHAEARQSRENQSQKNK